MGWTGTEMMVFFWVMLGIALFFVVVRLYVHVRGLRAKSSYRWLRDALVVGSWFFFLAGNVIFQILNDNDYFNEEQSVFASKPIGLQQNMYKLVFVQGFLFLPGIFLCKFDLLLLYHDLAPRLFHPKIFKLILLCWFFAVVGLLVQILALFLTCRPFNLNWAVPLVACVNTVAYFATVWTFHAFSDLFVYVLPLLIIRNMQKATRAEKLQAGAMFGLGFINIGAAFVMMIGLMPEFVSTNWAFYGACVFLAPVQQATALWIVCMPHLRTLFGGAGRRAVASAKIPKQFLDDLA